MITRRFIDFPGFGLGSHFAELERMRRQMDQILGRLQGEAPSQVATSGVFPLINLTEDSENYYIRAELPGVSADALDIQATGRNIAITGERRIPMEENARYHRRERESGRFSRAFTLPGDIDRDKISAGLADGILTLTIPKAPEAKPRQISIK